MAKKTAHVPVHARKKKVVVKKKAAAPPPPPSAPVVGEPQDELEDLDATNQPQDEIPGGDLSQAPIDPTEAPEEAAETWENEGGTQPVEDEREGEDAHYDPELQAGETAEEVTVPPPRGGTFDTTSNTSQNMGPSTAIAGETTPTGPPAPSGLVTPVDLSLADITWRTKTAVQLGVLLDYGELPVVEFRTLADLGPPHHPTEAKRVLDGFVEQGLVKTMWRASKNRYSLTNEGEVTANQLREQLGE